jgi:hypothetical protein
MSHISTTSRAIRGPVARRLARLSPALIALWGPVSLADAKVQAQLSERALAYGQPVTLTLTAQGDSVEGPDLSVLEPDFQILDRRVERRVATRNGQRSAQVRLNLLLLPRRDGTLVLPAISFGQARTEPLTLTVEPDTGQPTESPDLPFQPQGRIAPGQPEPVWGGGYPGLLPMPGPQAPWRDQERDQARDQAPVPPIDLTPNLSEDGDGAARPQRASESPGIGRNPWFWVSVGLTGVLAGLLATRRRVAATPAAPAVPAPEPIPSSPLDLALDQVRAAYGEANAGAARESLLAWARLRWPDDPPGNLARLAQRCPQPLRDRINRLEMAFFSPDPIPWEREPVPQELAALGDGRSAA